MRFFKKISSLINPAAMAHEAIKVGLDSTKAKGTMFKPSIAKTIEKVANGGRSHLFGKNKNYY